VEQLRVDQRLKQKERDRNRMRLITARMVSLYTAKKTVKAILSSVMKIQLVKK
jgi:hypothetical protein